MRKEKLARAALDKIGKSKFKVWAVLDGDKPKTMEAFDTFGDILLDAYNAGRESVGKFERPPLPPFDCTAYEPLGDADCYTLRALKKYGDECYLAGSGHAVPDVVAQTIKVKVAR